MDVLPSEILRYVICMEEVNTRIKVIEDAPSSLGRVNFIDPRSEIIAVQYRKILELIAFGSLIANRAKYSLAYRNYTSHWKAKELLDNLKIINPKYYPIPLKPAVLQRNGTKHFGAVTKNYLTEEQFISLYDDCGSILHTHNPYKLHNPKRFSPDSITKWTKYIKGLLNVHLARLFDVEGWVVYMNYDNTGKVHAFPFTAVE